MSNATEAELAKLKVPELKAELTARGLEVKGLKKDLIERLLAAFTVEKEQSHLAPSNSSDEPKDIPPEEPLNGKKRPAEMSADHVTEESNSPKSKRVKLEPQSKPKLELEPMPQTSIKTESIPPAHDVKPEQLKGEYPDVEEDSKPKKEEQIISSEDEQDDIIEPEFQLEKAAAARSDLYLDTIDRTQLEFDFEKLCSITLSTNNVYACLVCGKYFRGRGEKSVAYTHSLQVGHHVFLNLETKKTYILPDNYEVYDPSLNDIMHVLDPKFEAQNRIELDVGKYSYDLNKRPYLPGFVGLNNVKYNDYMNVIVHSLVHIEPIRNFFLYLPQTSSTKHTELVTRFSNLTRKIWNPRLFKAQVSPQEFMQQVSTDSAGRFSMMRPSDPLDFLSWLLNRLHKDLGGSKSKQTVITKTFQGIVQMESQVVRERDDRSGTDLSAPVFEQKGETKLIKMPFLFLSLDLPPLPIFQASTEQAFIPQVAISDVLSKYDGVTTQESAGLLRRFKISELPTYLILHVKRFTKTQHVEEQNFTVLNFPVTGLNMQEYVSDTAQVSTHYDLVSNVTLEMSSGVGKDASDTSWKTHRNEANTAWRAQLRSGSGASVEGRSADQWFDLQDLTVDKIDRQKIFLNETYLQFWERKTTKLEATN